MRKDYVRRNNTTGTPYVSSGEVRLKKRRRRMRNEQKIKMLIIAAMIILAAFIAFKAAFGKNAFNVKVGDNVICTIEKSRITSDDIKNTAQAAMIKELGTNIQIRDNITLVPVHASKKKTVTEEYAITQVKKAAAYNVEAGVIRIGGEKTLVLNSKDSADKLLNDILSSYAADGETAADYKFKLGVQTSAEYVDSQEITSYDEALKKLTQVTAEKRQHTVVKGDTVNGIAKRYGMSLAELFTANPGLDEKSILHIGDVFNVTVQVPFLEVERAEGKTQSGGTQ